MSHHRPRLLVVGCGGIGGYVSAQLCELGVDVVASTTNAAIARAISQHGFRLRDDGQIRTVRGTVSLGLPSNAPPFDYVLLATQPPQVEAAAESARAHLAEDGRMVCFQNGLCEVRVGKLVGKERVIGGVVAWGASMPEPGLYDRTAPGGFTLGRVDDEPDERVHTLARLLEAAGPVTLTSNLLGTRWSKLALNCAVSTMGTIGGVTLGTLLRVRRYRRLCLEIMSEVVTVARREGVVLEKISGTLDLDWIALRDHERRASVGSPALAAKHALLIAVGLRYRRMRSSMLSAIERGRTPAIDFLNGEVVSRGRQHGVPTPINERLVAEVHAIAQGEAGSSLPRLDAVCREVGV